MLRTHAVRGEGSGIGPGARGLSQGDLTQVSVAGWEPCKGMHTPDAGLCCVDVVVGRGLEFVGVRTSSAARPLRRWETVTRVIERERIIQRTHYI
jgi:hypothetical protein